MRQNFSFFGAVALIIGTQIGAGMLVLPTVLTPLGFFWGPVVLFITAFLLATTAVMLVEAIYLTNPRYHYFDIVHHYLGRFGIFLVLAILYAGSWALLAYISSLGQILSLFAGGDPSFWSFLTWVVLSLILFFGLSPSSSLRESLTVLMVLLVVTTFLWALPDIEPPIARFDLSAFILALGVSVFAFPLHTVIPEIVQGIRNMNKTIMAILFSFSIVFAVYALFSISVLGVAGSDVADIGTKVLVKSLGSDLAIIALILPLLAITTSFMSTGAVLLGVFKDLTRSRFIAWLFAVAPPLTIYILGYNSFVGAIWFASFGIIAASGVLPPILLLCARRERHRSLTPIPNWFAHILIAFFTVVLACSAIGTILGFVQA